MNMISQPKYEFQARANKEAAGKTRVVFSAYYGAGKTYLSLQWLDNLITAGRDIFPVLVLCTKDLIPQWAQQIYEHSHFTCLEVSGTNVTQKVAKLSRTDKQIFLLNYDAYRSAPVHRVLRTRVWRTLIVDESTALKETRTRRWEVLYKWCKQIPFKAFLTGRIITEDPTGAFGQMKFLDDGATFGNSFWNFRYKYQMPGPPWAPYDWTLKPGAAKQIADRLKLRCIFITKKELDEQLPPIEVQRIKFDWPKALRKKYVHLKNDFEIDLDDGTHFDTQWAVVKGTKLHQLCQGFIYVPRTVIENEKEKIIRDTHYVHTLKVDWLRENLSYILERGPVLIWSAFKPPLLQFQKMIEKDLKLDTGLVMGGQSDKLNQGNIEKFKQDNLDILLLSQAKACRGLDLWRAATAIFTSRSFSVEENENAARRCLRSGSEIHDKILYINLLMEKSTDIVVLDSLANKLDISNEILKHVNSKES